jgi:multisubunit Na+/H+ antiporter MnhB subunit
MQPIDTPTLLGTGFVVLAGFVWFFCAVLAYETAPKRGRRGLTWLILGIVFGPLALFALYLLPRGHVETHSNANAKKPTSQAALYEVPKKKKR